MRENHFTSDFRRVKMANSRDPRMDKVYDKKSIYYHCVSLKKLLSQEEQALMQPLEDSLRQQDKLRPPYGECHHCHDTGHWIGDCPEAKKLREQQMSTYKKKPAYGQNLSVDLQIIGLQIVMGEKRILHLNSLLYLQRSNRLSLQYLQRSLQGNERLLNQIYLISVLREDAWTLVQRRQPSIQRQGRSHIVSFVNQTLTHLDPVQRWWRRTGIKRFLMMNQTVTL